ncbi:MAG: hypothetical protein KA087_03070, partial [Candidatus Saccharicenans sp.]|nr:hypothetical protein [Candidatus Saccharicenans sp.]
VKIARVLLEKPESRQNPLLKKYYDSDSQVVAPYLFYQDYFTDIRIILRKVSLPLSPRTIFLWRKSCLWHPRQKEYRSCLIRVLISSKRLEKILSSLNLLAYRDWKSILLIISQRRPNYTASWRKNLIWWPPLALIFTVRLNRTFTSD